MCVGRNYILYTGIIGDGVLCQSVGEEGLCIIDLESMAHLNKKKDVYISNNRRAYNRGSLIKLTLLRCVQYTRFDCACIYIYIYIYI